MSIRSAADALAATYTTQEPSPDTSDGPQCLRYVWICYGSVQSNLPPLAAVAFAKQGWIYSKMQHPGDRTPPAGAPVYFSGSDGHIAIATGKGEEVRSTEWPWGHVGTTTISAIEQAWGRTYYGWTGDMLGHPIDFGTTTAGGNGTPINVALEDDMKLTAVQNYDKSVGIVGSDGLLTILTSINEWESYKRLGVVEQQASGDYLLHQEDGTVWKALVGVTARTRTVQSSTDPKAVAAALAPLLVSPILTAIQKSGVSLTQAQVEAATEAAIRGVFADAAS
jgi:hypothetical protein